MPKQIEECVKSIKHSIKPRKKGQTKESAAYAVCTASYKKHHSPEKIETRKPRSFKKVIT